MPSTIEINSCYIWSQDVLWNLPDFLVVRSYINSAVAKQRALSQNWLQSKIRLFVRGWQSVSWRLSGFIWISVTLSFTWLLTGLNRLFDWKIQSLLKLLIARDVFFFLSCELDTDDEVRDRATFYVNVLKQQQKALSSAFILNGKMFSVLWKLSCICTDFAEKDLITPISFVFVTLSLRLFLLFQKTLKFFQYVMLELIETN